MPATELTVTTALGKWSQDGVAITMTALDNTNGNKFVCPKDGLVVVQNTTGGALTVSITSQALSNTGRTGHIAKSIAANAIQAFRIVRDGWADVDNYVQLPSGQSASLKVGIVKFS